MFVSNAETINKSLLWGKYDNAYFNIGLASHRIDKFDNTIEQYRAAIKINPNDPRTLYNIGNTLADIGDYDKCEWSERIAI